MVGHPESLDLVAQLLVVRDHAHGLHVELAAAVAPQHVEQAVVGLRCHQGDPPAAVRIGDPPAHREAFGECAEGGLELLAPALQLGQEEDRAHEEGPLLGMRRELVAGDDVRAAPEQEAGHRGHDAGAVGTGHQQARAGAGALGGGGRDRGHQASSGGRMRWLAAGSVLAPGWAPRRYHRPPEAVAELVWRPGRGCRRAIGGGHVRGEGQAKGSDRGRPRVPCARRRRDLRSAGGGRQRHHRRLQQPARRLGLQRARAQSLGVARSRLPEAVLDETQRARSTPSRWSRKAP